MKNKIVKFIRRFIKEKPIYLIILVKEFKKAAYSYDATDNYEIVEPRIVGYTKKFKLAQQIIETNKENIFEGYYNYACIEAIRPGLYPYNIERWWYIWDAENKFPTAIDLPYQLGDEICKDSLVIY